MQLRVRLYDFSVLFYDSRGSAKDASCVHWPGFLLKNSWNRQFMRTCPSFRTLSWLIKRCKSKIWAMSIYGRDCWHVRRRAYCATISTSFPTMCSTRLGIDWGWRFGWLVGTVSLKIRRGVSELCASYCRTLLIQYPASSIQIANDPEWRLTSVFQTAPASFRSWHRYWLTPLCRFVRLDIMASKSKKPSKTVKKEGFGRPSPSTPLIMCRIIKHMIKHLRVRPLSVTKFSFYIKNQALKWKKLYN